MSERSVKKVFCQKCSNPKRALHNTRWMISSGREPICYQAIDMPVEHRHVVIYEKGAEDFARKDPHWAEHEFIPVTLEQLIDMDRQMDEIFKDRPKMQEVMPERGICLKDDVYLVEVNSGSGQVTE